MRALGERVGGGVGAFAGVVLCGSKIVRRACELRGNGGVRKAIL